MHSDGNQIGQGNPDIMSARGTLVDPEFQYNPEAKPGEAGGTINPTCRKVLQSNIEMMFKNIKFKNDKANIGRVTNTIYDKNGKPQ